MITRIFLFLLMGLWLQSGTLLAQNSISNLDVALTEQRFDAIANEALSQFLDPGTYRVSVRLVLSGSLVTQTLRADSASGAASSADRLPALPFYQRGVESEIRRPQAPASAEPKTQTQSQVTIRSMSVSLWLSDQLDASQADFARRVVTEALKIDATRGDRLSVQREAMPVRKAPEAASSTAPLLAATDSLSSTTTVNAGSEPNRWPWIVLLGLALGVGAYLIWRFRFKKTTVTASEAVADETDFAIPALPAAPMMPLASAASASNAPLAGDPQFNVGRVTLSHLDSRIDAMEFLLHVFMIHAEEISRLMESWITTDSIAGTERVVNVLLLVDPKFLNAFKPYMSAGAYKQIERTMAVKAEMGVTKSAIDVLETMAQDVKKRFRVENGTVRLIALQQFDFVNHIEDSVLRMLLEAQSAETCALVLYHLDSQRASAILSSLPRELVEETLLLIPLVRGMEFAVYDRIAKQVFDAYHEWMRSQSLVVKGLMQTVFILESLTEELRVPYLNTMSVVDPLWSAKIRTNLITEETLDSVSDELLRPAVAKVNLDRLSILAVVVSEELSERMISFRTPREQVRLRQILPDAGSIHESVRRRELNDFLSLLREERTHHLDTLSAA